MAIDKEPDAYFVSDAHLGIRLAGYDDRESHLLAFLESLAGRAGRLFILGDLFDFWIEYDRFIRSDYFPTVHVLRKLTESGTDIHYLAGNHDFALGPFLTRHAGVTVHPGHVDLAVQGRRLHLYHGDGLLKADVGYRVMKKVLRNRFNQRLFRLLHPALGLAVASFFSGASRKFLGMLLREWAIEEYRTVALRYLDQGSDIVVFGHTHYPEIRTVGEKCYCNTGEWIRKYTYARMRDGVITLWRHTPAGQDQEVAPGSLK